MMHGEKDRLSAVGTTGTFGIGCTVGNGRIRIHRDENGNIGIGGYGGKTVTVRCRDEGIAVSTEYDGTVITSRMVSDEPAPPDALRAECVFRIYADESDSFAVVNAACMFDAFFDLTDFREITRPFGKRSFLCRGNGGEALLAVTDGRIMLSDGGRELRFSLSYSKIIIYISEDGNVTEEKYAELERKLRGIVSVSRYSSKPDDAVYRSSAGRFVKYYSERKDASGYPSPLSELIGYLRAEVCNSVSKQGGFHCDGGTLTEMAEIFGFAVCDRNRTVADGFVGFLNGIADKYGDIPYSVNADGSEPRFIPGLHDAGFDIAVTELCEYVRVFHKESDKTLAALIKKIVKRGCTLEKRGMLPFSGFEADACPLNRFCGSYFSSVGYVVAANKYLSLARPAGYEEKRITAVVSLIRERIAENFVSDGEIRPMNAERLSTVRYPKNIYGRCDLCGEERDLVRRATRYLCGDCIAKAVRSESVGAGEDLEKSGNGGRVSKNPVYLMCRLDDGYRLNDEHWLAKYSMSEPNGFDEYIGAAIYNKRSPEKAREYMLSAFRMITDGGEKPTLAKLCTLCKVMMRYKKYL